MSTTLTRVALAQLSQTPLAHGSERGAITGSGKLAQRFNSENHGLREAHWVITYAGIDHYVWTDTFEREERTW